MPTYDYECENCRYTFEKFQSITEQPIKKCPECGGPVRRLIGPGAALIFRGSGFYITDYRSSEYKEKARKESSASETPSQSSPQNKSEDKSGKS